MSSLICLMGTLQLLLFLGVEQHEVIEIGDERLLHNGVFETLEQVVSFYNAGGGAGLGLDVPNQAVEIVPLGLTDLEQYQLIEFLKALSPDYPNHVDIPDSVPAV